MSGVMAWLGRWGARILAGGALGIVAGVTGVISYTHIYRLTLALDQPVMVARLMPFGVDGLVIVGAVVLLQAPPGHPRLGWLGVVPGVAASLFANVESGIAHGWLAAGWAGVPAAAFALATFMFERWLKAQVDQGGTGGADVPPVTGPDAGRNGGGSQCPHGVARSAEDAVTTAYLHGRDCLGDAPSQRHLSTTFGLSRAKVSELVSALNGHRSDSDVSPES